MRDYWWYGNRALFLHVIDYIITLFSAFIFKIREELNTLIIFLYDKVGVFMVLITFAYNFLLLKIGFWWYKKTKMDYPITAMGIYFLNMFVVVWNIMVLSVSI